MKTHPEQRLGSRIIGHLLKKRTTARRVVVSRWYSVAGIRRIPKSFGFVRFLYVFCTVSCRFVSTVLTAETPGRIAMEFGTLIQVARTLAITPQR